MWVVLLISLMWFFDFTLSNLKLFIFNFKFSIFFPTIYADGEVIDHIVSIKDNIQNSEFKVNISGTYVNYLYNTLPPGGKRGFYCFY